MRKHLFSTLLFFSLSSFAWAQEGIAATVPESLFDVLKKGGPVVYVLGILSVIALALILVCLFRLQRGAIVTGRYMATADALLRKGDYLGLLAASNRSNEAVARIMYLALDFLTKNPDADFSEVREIAETEGAKQTASLQQLTTYLADIGTVAPMLGLLGTVFGMITSFKAMVQNVAPAVGEAASAELAGGISEALIATAVGLAVAIPALAAYAWFRGRVQRLISDLEGASTQLLSLLAARMRKSRSLSQPHE